ncbi:MAG: T9SS type A sorting domain-containing protein [Flavobacterium sp.]|nr:T9SS type A sorting domain-containing protein [Flavobacterium sp.]
MQKMILLIALFGVQIAFSQVPDWHWARSMGIHYNSVKQFTAVDPSGNSIVITDFITPSITFGNITVYNDSPSYYYSDIAIVKYDNQGNVVWAKAYGGPRVDQATAITTDTAGNFYIAGGFLDTITFDSVTLTADPFGVAGNFIAKFDTNGNLIFAKKVTNDSSGTVIRMIKTDNAENIYLTGFFNTPSIQMGAITLNYEDYNSAGLGSSYRTYVAKMDSQGNYLWAKASQSNDAHYMGIIPFGLDVDTNGNVYVGGHFGCNTIRFGTITLTKNTTYNYNFNMYLVKYDSNGNEIWARNAGSSYDNGTCTLAVKTDLNNNIYAAGYFSNIVSFGDAILSASGGSQQFIVKYDPSGNVLWAKAATATAGFNTIHSIDVDENNSLYTAGTYNNTQLNFGNGVTLTNPVPTDGAVFVVKYTPGGEAVWARKATSLNANNTLNIDCKSQNELYICGTFNNPTMTFGNQTVTKSENNYDLYLAKLYYEPLSTTDWNANKVQVYPNPAKDQLFINQPEAYTNYSVYNVSGAKITSGMIRPETGSIDVSELTKGIYILQLSDNGSKTAVIKIIKE